MGHPVHKYLELSKVTFLEFSSHFIRWFLGNAALVGQSTLQKLKIYTATALVGQSTLQS